MLALWIAPFTWTAARSVVWRPKAGLRVRGAALMCDTTQVDEQTKSFHEFVESEQGRWLPPYAQELLIDKAKSTITTMDGALRSKISEIVQTKEERDAHAARAAASEAARTKAEEALGQTEAELADAVQERNRQSDRANAAKKEQEEGRKVAAETVERLDDALERAQDRLSHAQKEMQAK